MEDAHLPQGTIRYRDTGSGEPLIFIHGLLVDSRLWDPAVALLSDGHRCIEPDLPLGCHRVPMNADADLTPPGVARLLIDFMDELGLERATLVGNDSGGAISQLVATAHPDRVGRLILTNSDTYSDFPPKLFAYLNLVKWFPSVLTALAQSMRLKPLRHSPLAYGVLSKTRLDDELLKSWLEPALGDAAIRRDTAKFIKGVSPRLTEQAAVDLQGFRPRPCSPGPLRIAGSRSRTRSVSPPRCPTPGWTASRARRPSCRSISPGGWPTGSPRSSQPTSRGPQRLPASRRPGSAPLDRDPTAVEHRRVGGDPVLARAAQQLGPDLRVEGRGPGAARRTAVRVEAGVQHLRHGRAADLRRIPAETHLPSRRELQRQLQGRPRGAGFAPAHAVSLASSRSSAASTGSSAGTACRL